MLWSSTGLIREFCLSASQQCLIFPPPALGFSLLSTSLFCFVYQQLHSSVRTGSLETCLRLLSLGAQANFFHPVRIKKSTRWLTPSSKLTTLFSYSLYARPLVMTLFVCLTDPPGERHYPTPCGSQGRPDPAGWAASSIRCRPWSPWHQRTHTYGLREVQNSGHISLITLTFEFKTNS